MTRTDMLARRLAARPLALAPRAVEALLGETPTPQSAGPGWQMSEGSIGHLPILGPLVQRGDWLTGLFGIASYDDIAAAAEAAFTDPGTRAVLMEIDSPGGEVAGLFDFVDRLAALKAVTGKPLWAIAREQALSASYAIASVADRLLVTQTGEVGSIGVIAVHVDQSAHDQAEGRQYTLIHAGAKKVDGNPHVPLSPEALADIQADVDDLYARLVARVARARGVNPEAIASTEAAIYRGQHAVAAGLADGIATLDGAHADLLAALDAPQGIAARAGRKNPQSTNSERTDTMAVKGKPHAKPAATEETTEAGATAAEMGATPEAATPAPQPSSEPKPAVTAAKAAAPAAAPVAPMATAPDPDMAVQIREQAAEIAEIAAQASRLGLTIDAAEAVRAGTSPDALRRAVLEQLAKTTDATIVASIAPPPTEPAPTESPLIAAARAVAANATT